MEAEGNEVDYGRSPLNAPEYAFNIRASRYMY